MTSFAKQERRNRRMAMLLSTAAALSFATSALPASAQTTTSLGIARSYTYGDNSAYITLANSYDGTAASLDTSTSRFAGSFTVTPNPAVAGLPTSFSAYCIQLGTGITNGQSATVQTLNSSFNLGKASDPSYSSFNYGGAISWLYNNEAPSITDQSEVAAQQSAALQLSIWEVEYNWNGTGLSGIDTSLRTGNFTYVGNTTDTTDTAITAAIRNASSAMLTDWSGKTDTATWLNSYSDNPSRQSLVAPALTGAASAPEPGALMLLIGPLGIVGAANLRRRRALSAASR